MLPASPPVPLPPGISWELVRRLIYALVFPGVLAAMGAVMLTIWFERKIAARVQMRIGPYYASPHLHGLLQVVADGARFFFQEIIVPKQVDKLPFIAAPAIEIILISLAYLGIPATPHAQAIPSSFSLVYVVMFLTVTPIFVVVAGWAANNKYALIGAARKTLMNVAYEPLLLAAAAAAALLYGTLDLVRIVAKQSLLPGVILNPLAALLFYIAMMVATDRVPFDLVLGEQEIVAGPYVEYTGIMFGLTMAADYMELYALSALFTLLFLGGWLPATSGIAAAVVFYVKTLLVMWSVVFFRTVYPRIRLDRALELLWRKLIPLAFAAMIISPLVAYALGLWR